VLKERPSHYFAYNGALIQIINIVDMAIQVGGAREGHSFVLKV
jgi:hypothetical protein